MFRRILIANRGEIAVRIARACRENGIESALVYSSADAESPALRHVDHAVHIGPAQARNSYLDVPSIIGAAHLVGADAIHPGYGFLSEDPDIADICADEGLTFIGPTPASMAVLGSKVAVRNRMAEAGVPVPAGSREPVRTAREAVAAAARIGGPVVVKAAAGGGGRGIAAARDAGEVVEAFHLTTATASAVFGDDTVYVERRIPDCRHIEAQVLRDAFGTTVFLGERDCTVQRRCQKLIEEAPAPGLPETTRTALRDWAVRGMEALDLLGLATMEFLLGADGELTFIEVNARLQVEHPVTEMTTGLDVVREQIRVAAGEPVSASSRVPAEGAAIEFRINAEDPAADFRPSPGLLRRFDLPGGPWTRVDTGYEQGSTVPAFYDSLLAKVIVWAPTRAEALCRGARALGELRVEGPGVETTTRFLQGVLAEQAFRRGEHTTDLVERMQAPAAAGPGGGVR